MSAFTDSLRYYLARAVSNYHISKWPKPPRDFRNPLRRLYWRIWNWSFSTLWELYPERAKKKHR